MRDRASRKRDFKIACLFFSEKRMRAANAGKMRKIYKVNFTELRFFFSPRELVSTILTLRVEFPELFVCILSRLSTNSALLSDHFADDFISREHFYQFPPNSSFGGIKRGKTTLSREVLSTRNAITRPPREPSPPRAP